MIPCFSEISLILMVTNWTQDLGIFTLQIWIYSWITFYLLKLPKKIQAPCNCHTIWSQINNVIIPLILDKQFYLVKNYRLTWNNSVIFHLNARKPFLILHLAMNNYNSLVNDLLSILICTRVVSHQNEITRHV